MRVACEQSAAGKQGSSGDYAIWDLELVLSPNEGSEACDMRVDRNYCDSS